MIQEARKRRVKMRKILIWETIHIASIPFDEILHATIQEITGVHMNENCVALILKINKKNI